MNVNPVGSAYRYCIFRLATSTNSRPSPDFHVCSTTFPFVSDFSRARTNADPFPGFTCWNSVTTTMSFLNLRYEPLAISAVVRAIVRGRFYHPLHPGVTVPHPSQLRQPFIRFIGTQSH